MFSVIVLGPHLWFVCQAGRFKRLLLSGRQLDMVLLGVLTYCLLDVTTQNTFIAVRTTNIVSSTEP